MMKIFISDAVVSRGYDGAPAIRLFNSENGGEFAVFQVGIRKYDSRAENNHRWVNLKVKAFGDLCERIKKMSLKEGSFISLCGDYDEERRLMFVVMSRARQYETLICGPRPSKFMTGLSCGNYSDIPECPPVPHDEDADRAERPVVTGYTPRRKKIGVHSLMSFGNEDGMGGMSESDEFGSGGKDHGTDVHNAAQAVFERWPVQKEYPELEMIRRIVAETERADLRYCEMDCTLPVPEHGAVLSGRIDLMAVYPDRVEIHDYKTDASDRFEAEYEFQLSVYAEAASRYYGRRAVCIIDYVTMGYSKTFEPLGMDVISERVRTYLESEREKINNSEAE